jgi:diamine N-acetyltransferase
MHVRPARSEDVPALARINAEVQALHLAAVPARYRDASTAELEAWFAAALGAGDRAILVADDGGGVAGYVVVRRDDRGGDVFAHARRVAHVDQLGVRADGRRRGVGRLLMAAAEDAGRRWGCAAVTLDVQAFNEDATRFYRSIGYAPVATRMGRPIT